MTDPFPPILVIYNKHKNKQIQTMKKNIQTLRNTKRLSLQAISIVTDIIY